MARKLRTTTEEDRGHIERAIAHLRAARADLRDAGCKAAANYVQRALKSAEGAERHALRAVPDDDKFPEQSWEQINREAPERQH